MELMNEMNMQMATLPKGVSLWMNWMTICYLLSILFVWKHKAARFALLVFALTMPGSLLIFKLTKTVHLLGIIHFVLWLPLAIFIYKTELKSDNFNKKSLYGVWIYLLLSTIGICLIFDLWDFSQIALGHK